MPSSFPGGLRAQFLLGLSLLLAGSVALGAVLVENVLTRRLLASHEAHLTSVAALATQMDGPARAALVDEGVVDALLAPDSKRGEPALLARLARGDEAYVSVDGVLYLRVTSANVTVAGRVEDVRASVASARSTLIMFGLLVVIVVLTLGYGFFSFVVVRPIRAIGVATERAAQGDLASPISVVPKNEIGRVAHSFNEMLRRIEVSREELQQKVVQLQDANAALEATRDSLVRSEKLASVGQLAAGIAHEIGNPLAALSGYNELLRDGQLDADEAQDLLRRNGEQLDRIRGVIRNLLDFSRDETQAEPSPTALSRCVEEAVSLARVGARASARKIQFEVGEMDGPTVLTVSSQIVQVLLNLTMNAVDVLGDGGRIRLRRRDTEDGFALLTVEDDGPGVPNELLNRIFDPFFTTKEPGEGTGLGLAISARIVESFGGGLDVGRSELGGAKFEVRLPHARSADGT